MDTAAKKLKVKSKDYPAITLDQAIEFVTKLKDYPVGKPISYDAAAKEVKISPTTKSFTYSISAARQYGLISTSAGNTLSFLDPANRLARPVESVQDLARLKMQCFATPKLYSELISQYNGKSMPQIKTLENVLINYHGIAPNAALTAAQTFIDTANEIGAIKSGVLNLEVPAETIVDAPSTNSTSTESSTEAQPTNEGVVAGEAFDKPLSIPFGDRRRALLYMPLNTETEDAEYALEMIKLMFRKVYGVKQI